MQREPDMDVFQRLIQDHRIAEQRFAEIEKTSEKEADRRELLFAKLREELEAHEVFEEEYLYPEIDEVLSAKAVVGEALDEHAEFDAILQEISAIPANKGEWLERICELKEMVQKHVRKEEEKMFPVARSKLARGRAEELGRKNQERQKSL
jgi:iron-sulfur cluster repair protein YtfE (RIC family)